MKKKIIIVGDLFPVVTNINKFSDGDINYLFGEKICDLFDAADYRICNLEGPLTNRPGKCEKTGLKVYAPTSVVTSYKKLHIDCCTLANNHITDAGDEGVIDTMKTLDSVDIDYIGAGLNRDAINHKKFIKLGNKVIGFFNVAETMFNAPTAEKPGAFLYDEYIVCNELRMMKKQSDYIIVIYHGGAEKFRYPSPQTRLRFHRMADCGADMILSQHTHCIGCEEIYNGSYLLYGQGNFLFRSYNNEYTDTGLIIELQICSDSFKVKKHLVEAINDTVRYSSSQNFYDFDERSKRVTDDAFIKNEYIKYCEKELTGYLMAFKSPSKVLGLWNRLLYRGYRKWLFSSAYSRYNLLKILHTLRSEQNRETAITGITHLLEEQE